MKDSVKIIPMVYEHLDEIIEIDKEYSTKPWSRELFARELFHNFSYNFTLIYYNKIAGFINFWFVSEAIELNNFAIKKNFRKKGLGKLLLDFLIKISKFLKAKKIYLEVKSDNIPAYKLYKLTGFKEIGFRKKYYSDGKDAILMERLV